LNGAFEYDLILGRRGNDRIDGAGEDTINAGSGQDDIPSNSGDGDHLSRGSDHDRINGDSGTYNCLSGEELTSCELKYWPD